MNLTILGIAIGMLSATMYHIGKGTDVKGLKASAVIFTMVIIRIMWYL